MAGRKPNPHQQPAPPCSSLSEALELSRIETRYTGGRLRLETGKYLLDRVQFDSAEICFDEVIRARPIDAPLLAETLIAKAELHRRKGALGKAETCLDRALECLGTAPAGKNLLGPLWKKRGDLELTRGRGDHALEAYQRARAEFAEQKSADQEATAAFLAGGAAAEAHRLEVALQQYRDAASKSETPAMALAGRLGEVSALTALHRAEEALEKCRELGEAIAEAHLPREQKRELSLRVREKEAHNRALQGDFAKAVKVLEACLLVAPLEEQACHYAQLAEWLFVQGSAESAGAYAEEAQSLCKRMGVEIPSVLLSISRLELMRGNVRASEQRFFEAQVEAPKRLAPGGMLDYDLHQLSLHVAKGEFTAAEELAHRLRECLSLHEPKPLTYASVLNTLGSISQMRGALDKAESLHREALAIADQFRAPLERARSLGSLANTEASRSSDGGKALLCLDEAIATIERFGLKLVEHAYLIQREVLAGRVEGDLDHRLERISELLVTGYRFQSTAVDIQALLALGVLNWQDGEDPSTALSYFEDAAEVAAESGQQFCEILAKGLRGGALQDLGETGEAKELLEEVLQRMDELGLDIVARHEFGERYHDLGGFWFQGLR